MRMALVWFSTWVLAAVATAEVPAINWSGQGGSAPQNLASPASRPDDGAGLGLEADPNARASEPASTPASESVKGKAEEAVSTLATTQPATNVATSQLTSMPTTTSAPSLSDSLAAASLRHSAECMVYSSVTTPGRAGRLVALAKYAWKLQPGDVKTAWLLSNIYETQGDSSAAEEMTGLRLRANPADFGLAMDYVRLALAARSKPDDQQEFLESLMADETLTLPIRAQIVTRYAQLLNRFGQAGRAQEVYVQALQWDPYNAAALSASVGSQDKKPDPAEIVKFIISLLKTNPRSTQLVQELAARLEAVGLSEQALVYQKYLWQMTIASAKGKAVPPVGLAAAYLNDLMDVGKYDQAVEIFDPIQDKYSEAGFSVLMIEAYRGAGMEDKAEKLVKTLLESYEAQAPVYAPASSPETQPASAPATSPETQVVTSSAPSSAPSYSPSVAAELAWFYIAISPNPEKATALAEEGYHLNPNDAMNTRSLAAARLVSGDEKLVSAGRDQLEEFKTIDPWSAVLLAESYYATGEDEPGKAALLAGLSIVRGGTTCRRLLALARKHNVDPPPMKSAEGIRQVLEQFNPAFLDMGLNPGKYLKVTLKPASDVMLPGQPLEIEALMTNIGSLDIMLGDWGLVNPTMSLQVTAAPLTKERFDKLPTVVWPAPRYLAPGQTVSAKVRLDIANLDVLLAKHPLEDVTLKVTSMLDPVEQRNFEKESSLPDFDIEPLTVTRRSLLGRHDANDPQAQAGAYQYALRVIMTDLVRGDLPRRMQAARQIGSLLAMARDAEIGRIRLSEGLKSAVNKNVLLAMMQKAMQDPSDAVRAEMLTAMENVRLDEGIMSLLSKSAGDVSPLVRFRFAELVGSSRLPRQEKFLETLSQDSDPLVQSMAQAFGESFSR